MAESPNRGTPKSPAQRTPRSMELLEPPASPFAAISQAAAASASPPSHAVNRSPSPAQMRREYSSSLALRPDSSASTQNPPLSVSSSMAPRFSLPLEMALSTMERPDGAREARTLLPGVDLSQHFGMAVSLEGQLSNADIDERSTGGALPVLQTPKGVNLREAVWEAAAMTRRTSSSAGTNSRPPSAQAPSAASFEESPAEHQEQLMPGGSSMSPWESVLSALAEASPTGIAAARAATPDGAEEQTESSQSLQPSQSTNNILPSSSLSNYNTPTAMPAVPAVPSTSARTPTRPGGLPQLRVDVDFTPAGLNIMSPSLTPGAAGLISPGPLLTPGAPPSVPLELRAAAAERLWPLLAPFAPHMLRQDILLPPSERRFVKTASDGSTSPSSTSNSPRQQTPSPWMASSWRIDTDMRPAAYTFNAVVALADVSGFTALTEALSRRGTGGVELLTRCMNSYFAQVIDLVTLHGGDVSKFAGDAMLIVFEPTEEERKFGEEKALELATRRAAIAVKELVDKYGVMSMEANGDATPLDRRRVARSGSKFVRLQQAGINAQPEGSASATSTPRFVTAAVTPFNFVAKTGQKVAQVAVNAGVVAPLAVGSKALNKPFRKKPAAAESDGNKRERGEIWLDWLDTTNGTADGSEKSADQLAREFEQMEEEWAAGRRVGSGTASAGSTPLPLPHKYHPSRSHLPPKSTPLGPSKLINTGKRVGSATELGALAEVSTKSGTAATSSVGTVIDPETEAQRLRDIHERTLASFVSEFTGGGAMLKVRPPELPSNRGETAVAEGLMPLLHRGFSSSPALSSPRQQQLTGVAEEDEEHSSDLNRTAAVGSTTSQNEVVREVSFFNPSHQYDRHTRFPSYHSEKNPADPGEDRVASTSSTSFASTRDKALSSSPQSFSFRNGGNNNSEEALQKESLKASMTAGGSFASSFRSISDKEDVSRAQSSFESGQTQRQGHLNHPSAVRRLVSSAFGRSSSTLNRTTGSATKSMRSGSASSMSQGVSRLGSFAHLGTRFFLPSMKRSTSSAPCSPQNSPPGSPQDPNSHPQPYSPAYFSFERGQSPANADIFAAGAGDAADLPSDLLSLKVTLSAGSLCAYRVGGIMEPTISGSPEAARWEFFIADAEKGRGSGGNGEEAGPSAALKDGARGPIAQIRATEEHVQPGDVVVSEEVAALLGSTATEMVRLDDGSAKLMSVKDIKESTESTTRFEMNLKRQVIAEGIKLAQLSAQERVNAYQILRSHVPYNVRLRVEAGHIDSVNEVRVCTVVFLGFPGLDNSTAASLAAVQTATQNAQGRMHQDGGFFLQMRCDEKGYIALCAFGLPGRAHEDSPARGVRAALAVVQALKRQGFAAVAGVTTGNLFCGVVGSSRRAEYTVYGDAINLAARLMVRAAQSPELGPVLCDEPTRWMASGRAEFTALEPMVVKGKAAPLRAFMVASAGEAWYMQEKSEDNIGQGVGGGEPSPMLPRLLAAQREHEEQQLQLQKQQSLSANNEAATVDVPVVAGRSTTSLEQESESDAAQIASHAATGLISDPILLARTALVGREKEMSIAANRLASLVDGHGGGALFLEGDAGMGKTRLAEEIAWGTALEPLRQRCTVLVSAGRAMRQSEPLNPWRRIFRQAFEADIRRSAERRATTDAGNASCSLPQQQQQQQQQQQPPSDLAIRLAERLPDYAVWRPVIASALGLSEEYLPPIVVQYEDPSVSLTSLPGVALDDRSVVLISRAHTIAHGIGGGYNLTPSSSSPTSAKTTPKASPEKEASGPSSGGGGGGRSPSKGQAVDFSRAPAAASVLQRSVSATNLDPGRRSPSSTSAAAGIGPPPSEMSVPLRALKVRGLLVAILREYAACHGPMLIGFDDLHLFDSPSWRMVLAVLAALPKSVLLLGTLRPVLPLPSAGGSTAATPGFGPEITRNRAQMGSGGLPLTPSAAVTPVGPGAAAAAPAGLGPDEVFTRKLGEYYEEALWRDGSERLILQPFSVEEARQFLSLALGGAQVPPAAAQLLWEKSAGMPAFLHQVAIFFRLRAQDEALRAAQESTNPRPAPLGGLAKSSTTTLDVARLGMDFVRATVNVHSIVPARVDRLRPDEQLTLKVASVMGTTVYTELLRAIHPKSPSTRRLRVELRALQAAGFLVSEKESASSRSSGNGTEMAIWRFTDVLARDVVYEMIPSTQRREWHGRLAAAMVGFNTDVAASGTRAAFGKRPIPAAIVAYHWTQACIQIETSEWQAALQAVLWWERAAAEAAQSGAFDEEISLLHNAATLAFALVPSYQYHTPEAVNVRPDLIPAWRMARWERCAAAAMLEGSSGQEAVVTRDALEHCLRALEFMHVPLPWSQEYYSSLAVESRSIFSKRAVGNLFRKLTGRKSKVTAIDGCGCDNPFGSAIDDVIDAEGFASAASNADYAYLARINVQIDGEVAETDEKAAVAATLTAALLAMGPDSADSSMFEYAIWVCEKLAGGRSKMKKGSALCRVRKLLEEEVKSVAERRKNPSVAAATPRMGSAPLLRWLQEHWPHK